MELLTDKLNAVLASVGTHSTAEERAACADRLRLLIVAYGKAQAVAAIQLEHQVFQSLGLATVDADALAALNTKMAELASASGEALQDSDVAWLKAGVPAAQNYMTVAHPATVDFEGRAFRIPDPDLQHLMDDTEALLTPGANMDIGLSWADSLDVVLKRLRADRTQTQKNTEDSAEQDNEVDPVDPVWIRYRVHMVADNVMGRQWLIGFKSGKHTLRDLTKGLDHASKVVTLFDELGAEFGIELTTEDRTALLDMTTSQIGDYFNNRTDTKGPGCEKEKAPD